MELTKEEIKMVEKMRNVNKVAYNKAIQKIDDYIDSKIKKEIENAEKNYEIKKKEYNKIEEDIKHLKTVDGVEVVFEIIQDVTMQDPFMIRYFESDIKINVKKALKETYGNDNGWENLYDKIIEVYKENIEKGEYDREYYYKKEITIKQFAYKLKFNNHFVNFKDGNYESYDISRCFRTYKNLQTLYNKAVDKYNDEILKMKKNMYEKNRKSLLSEFANRKEGNVIFNAERKYRRINKRGAEYSSYDEYSFKINNEKSQAKMNINLDFDENEDKEYNANISLKVKSIDELIKIMSFIEGEN